MVIFGYRPYKDDDVVCHVTRNLFRGGDKKFFSFKKIHCDILKNVWTEFFRWAGIGGGRIKNAYNIQLIFFPFRKIKQSIFYLRKWQKFCGHIRLRAKNLNF